MTKIFALVQALLAVILVLASPRVPAFYSSYWQLLPLLFALPFFLPGFKFNEQVRARKPKHVFIFCLVQVLSIALDYALKTHIGLYTLALGTLPAIAIWAFRFVRWNFRCVRNKECLSSLAICAIAWGFFALAYPPLPLGPAVLVLLAPWFLVMKARSSDAVLFATFWSSVLCNMIGYYWLVNTTDLAPLPLMVLGFCLLLGYFAMYSSFAALGFLAARKILIKGRPLFLLGFPLFYSGLEMTRTVTDLAFPWTHLGYTLGNHLELLQMLPYIGVFGYTALILYSNMALARGIERRNYALCAVPLVIFLALLAQGKLALSGTEPFERNGKEEPLEVSLVQPSILHSEKRDKAMQDSVVERTFRLAYDSVPATAKLIAFSETALPDYIKRNPEVSERLQKLANKKRAHILFGALDHERLEKMVGTRRYNVYNSSFHFKPFRLTPPERYDKRRLVPFSEKIPFDGDVEIIAYIDYGESDFIQGKATPVYKPYNFSPYICYDAIFGDIIREAIRDSSRLMVNLTNDAWFGRSTEPWQHLNIIRYRAIEHAYPVARIANSGISVFIDQHGYYGAATEIFTERVLTAKIPLRFADTPYTHLGDFIEKGLLVFLALYIAGMVLASKLSKRKPKNS